jgi:hypothetical protein
MRLQWTAGLRSRCIGCIIPPPPLRRNVGRCMYTPTCNSSVCRWYFSVVRRWPIVHFLICVWGVAVGIGGLFAFGDTTGNQRQVVASRIVGIFMLVVCGWILLRLVARVFRGSWARHCEARIVQCGGQPTASPNGGPAEQLGDSGVAAGPPSVS